MSKPFNGYKNFETWAFIAWNGENIADVFLEEVKQNQIVEMYDIQDRVSDVLDDIQREIDNSNGFIGESMGRKTSVVDEKAVSEWIYEMVFNETYNWLEE